MTTSLNFDVLKSIPNGNQEKLKHILIGDYNAILQAQDYLAVCRYAEKKFWSNLQPIGTTGEFISVLIKRSAANTSPEP